MTDRVEAMRSDLERAPQALLDLLEAYDAPDGPMRALDASRSPGGLRRTRQFAVRLDGRGLLLPCGRGAGMGGVRIRRRGAAIEGSRARGGLGIRSDERGGRPRPTPPGTSLVIAVTNVPGSPLAAAADLVLPLVAGVEVAGISTITFRATVVVLGLLAARLGVPMADHGDLWDTVARLDVDSEGANLWVARAVSSAADLLDGAPSIDVIGPAARLGAASQGALMLREGPRLPAHPWETADWLHSAVYLALPGHRALLFTGSPADAEVIDTVRRRGGEIVIVGEASTETPVALDLPAGDPRLHTITQSLAVDRLALELWRRVSAEG